MATNKILVSHPVETKKETSPDDYYYADTEEVIEIHYDKNGNETGRDVYRRPLSDPNIRKDRILYLSAGGKAPNGADMSAGEQSAEIIKEMQEMEKKAKRFNKKLDKAKDVAINNAKSMASVLQVWIGTYGLKNDED